MKPPRLEDYDIDPATVHPCCTSWAEDYRRQWTDVGWMDVAVFECQTFLIYRRVSPIDARIVLVITQYGLWVNSRLARAFAHRIAPHVDRWEMVFSDTSTAMRQLFDDTTICGA